MQETLHVVRTEIDARSLGTPSVSAIPTGVFTRVPLSPPLSEAIGAVLEACERETDRKARQELAARARAALEAWLEGELSEEQVARTLRLATRPDVRLVR
jgi:hypothetical protein